MRRAIVPLVLVLAACQSEDAADSERDARTPRPAASATPAPIAPAPAERAAPSLALAVDGLRLALEGGAARLIPYGIPRAQAEDAIGRALDDRPRRTAVDECGEGPMEFTDYGPLQLNFLDGKFVGWYLDGAGGPSTVDGLAIGATRAEARAGRVLTMIPESTLDDEFAIGDLAEYTIGGFFDGPGADAKVSQLFAGTNCFFR